MALKNFTFGLFPNPLEYVGSITTSENIQLLRDLYEFLEKEEIPFDKRKKELAYRCEYKKENNISEYKVYDISDNLLNIIIIDNNNNTIELIRNP
ncbi:hypothetical protein [Clostridium thermobutyricum]|uniref:Uncharacterized protein n=1 Tax=Clostridium thermobutyricum DSM 4928 TaxID=1121339 RepID=A0A1V4SSR7_9CLOT|nr:hypothetical protein [Clostridium thermobutyricum]OPX46884.1 hypothetical protein CLTHE_24380 [Clostridium thermobutyricum DSM 4928]